jgi:hypothetical protein
MRGSGAVPQDAIDELDGALHELKSLVDSMERYVHQVLGADRQDRP